MNHVVLWWNQTAGAAGARERKEKEKENENGWRFCVALLCLDASHVPVVSANEMDVSGAGFTIAGLECVCVYGRQMQDRDSNTK